MPTIRNIIQYTPMNDPKPDLDYRYGPWESENDFLETGNIPVNGLKIGIIQEDDSIKEMRYVKDPEDNTQLILVENGAGTTDYTDLDNKPTISGGGQGSTQIPLTGNVKVTASTASGDTAGVTVTPGQTAGEIEMQFTLPKGDNGENGANGVTPTIDPTTKHWMMGNTDTNIVAEGQDGQNGAPGHNPCLGRFASMPSTFAETPKAGDYYYVDTVIDATTTPPTVETKIYKYDGSEWDNGTVVDVSNQTFSSGETVIGTAIDGTGLVNPAANALAKAGDVMSVKGALEGVTFSEGVPSYSVGDGYVSGTSGGIFGSSASKHVVVTLPTGCRRVRFLGVRYTADTNAGFAFYGPGANDVLAGTPEFYEQNTGAGSNELVEYVREVPEGAKYFKTCALVGQVLNLTNFYVYSQVGETVLDVVEEMIAEAVVGEDGGRRVVSIASGKLVSSQITIGASTGNWVSSSGSYYLVPVVPGDKMLIKASPTGANQYAFLTGIPVDPQAGETPNYATGCTLMFLNSSSSPEMERTEVVPADARYMYVRTLHVPELVVAEGDAVKGYETWIEENYVSVKDSGGLRYKFYEIEDGVPYKAVIRIDENVSVNAVLFFDAVGQEISGSGIWPGTGVEQDKVMEDVAIPAGTRYVRLQYKVVPHPGYYTSTGGAGLMRPLLYDGWVPTNKVIYCVSKVSAPVMPYDYDEADTTFPREETWSAWAFMLPDVARSGAGKPFPLVSFFHGSSGFVTPDAMGYDAAGTDDGIVGRLLAAGCAVFDINGYGVSFHIDEHSQHWGCPLAVATVKKAYTILTERFNCRKGMVLSCISMGGAITKSYAMTYPEDVVACAMEAPSEIGCTVRRTSAEDGNFALAWGGLDAESLIGYSPLVRPMWIKTINVGGVDYAVPVAVAAGDIALSDYITNSSGQTINQRATTQRFVAPFPVEAIIWHGDADSNVALGYSEQFARTARNAGSNVKLRVCPGCPHNLNTIPWVLEEVVEYIVDKVGC